MTRTGWSGWRRPGWLGHRWVARTGRVGRSRGHGGLGCAAGCRAARCRPASEGPGCAGGQPREQVVGVVVEPAGAVEQLPDGDALAARGRRHPATVSECRPVAACLGDQLQHHRGHERLGHAADPEPVGGAGRVLDGQLAQAAAPCQARWPARTSATAPGAPASTTRPPAAGRLPGSGTGWVAVGAEQVLVRLREATCRAVSGKSLARDEVR
jgi:hypothetical protein